MQDARGTEPFQGCMPKVPQNHLKNNLACPWNFAEYNYFSHIGFNWQIVKKLNGNIISKMVLGGYSWKKMWILRVVVYSRFEILGCSEFWVPKICYVCRLCNGFASLPQSNNSWSNVAYSFSLWSFLFCVNYASSKLLPSLALLLYQNLTRLDCFWCLSYSQDFFKCWGIISAFGRSFLVLLTCFFLIYLHLLRNKCEYLCLLWKQRKW